jgi:hypothetical protein
MIDFTKPNDMISANFKVHEALLLPSWGVMHVPSHEELNNIFKTVAVMEQIRALFHSGINVHCWIRPKVANIPGSVHDKQDYNALVGGAKASAHIYGLAVDFDVSGLDCDTVRAGLVPELGRLNICMEKAPGTNWVHIDLMAPRGGYTRYFIP